MAAHLAYSKVSLVEEGGVGAAEEGGIVFQQEAASPISTAPATRYRTRFAQFEEARHLEWTDPYYEGRHGVVAAFDRDGVSAGRFLAARSNSVAAAFAVLGVAYWALSLTAEAQADGLAVFDDFEAAYLFGVAALFAFVGWRTRQSMLVQHVALTTEGIRIDNGPIASVTVPYEHVHKCEAVQQTHCCKILTAMTKTVIVHRTAMPLERLCFQKTKKMELHGILLADEFAKLVVALKDAERDGTYEAANSGMELSSMVGVSSAAPEAGSGGT